MERADASEATRTRAASTEPTTAWDESAPIWTNASALRMSRPYPADFGGKQEDVLASEATAQHRRDVRDVARSHGVTDAHVRRPEHDAPHDQGYAGADFAVAELVLDE